MVTEAAFLVNSVQPLVAPKAGDGFIHMFFVQCFAPAGKTQTWQ